MIGFEPIRLSWDYAYAVGLPLFVMWLMPLLFLALKMHRIAVHCGKSGEDEVNFILEFKHPLAKSWWRTLFAWIGLTLLWLVV